MRTSNFQSLQVSLIEMIPAVGEMTKDFSRIIRKGRGIVPFLFPTLQHFKTSARRWLHRCIYFKLNPKLTCNNTDLSPKDPNLQFIL